VLCALAITVRRQLPRRNDSVFQLLSECRYGGGMKIKIQITIESDAGNPAILQEVAQWIAAPYERRLSG
jgi:hypothetical protein